MRVITIAVIKGGTGKTTTAAALAQAAAAAGKRVLCIDLDPQANFSISIGADPNRSGSYQLLHGGEPKNLIQRTEQGLDAITASPDLATEKTKPASAKRLQTAIEPLKKRYDYIIIDTPPTMGEVTYNALQASTDLIIPIRADAFGVNGLYQITDIAHQMQQHNPKLKRISTIITQYDARPKISRYMREAIEPEAVAAGAPIIGVIRKSVIVTEAQALQQSLIQYAPKSKPAQDYISLFKTIQRSK